MVDGVDQVVGARPEEALCRRDHLGDAVVRQESGVALVRMIDHERDRADGAERGMDVDPARHVGAAQHLAAPDDRQLLLDRIRRDVKGDAAARAASFQTEHQAGALRAAAPEVGPQAKPAMMSQRPFRSDDR